MWNFAKSENICRFFEIREDPEVQPSDRSVYANG